MTEPPVPSRRHDSLIPFSRDHHPALVRAMALKKAEGASPSERLAALAGLRAEWEAKLREHFLAEERLLDPLMDAAERARLHAEHDALRRDLEEAGRQAGEPPKDGFCAGVGAFLERHIRWEERELFNAIERRATPQQLEDLAEGTRRYAAGRSL